MTLVSRLLGRMSSLLYNLLEIIAEVMSDPSNIKMGLDFEAAS